MVRWVKFFAELKLTDVPQVGGKNASLGEMLQVLTPLGIQVPNGFATTSEGYFYFLESNKLLPVMQEKLSALDPTNVAQLEKVSEEIRNLMVQGELPPDLEEEIRVAYRQLCREAGEENLAVAVRSSATAEDLPTASFAGQQESYLYIQGEADLLFHVKQAMASLFTARAISYRAQRGFDHLKVALSVGVQRMIHAAASGVIFTLDPDTGHPDFVYITAGYGVGENIVQGRIEPDGYYVHKPTAARGYPSLIYKRLGSKEYALSYDPKEGRLVNQAVPLAQRRRFCLSDKDVLTLAGWAMKVEAHYTAQRGVPTPMDIEWVQDARTGELFIVQARPETVHSQRVPSLRVYNMEERGEVLVEGLAVGDSITHGRVRVLHSPAEMGSFQPGEILVTQATHPDWEPIMKKAAAIITERGGRTSHAAIVARELGIPALVAAANATEKLSTGQIITLSCAEGEIGRAYAGQLRYTVEEIDPASLPTPRTKILLNVGTPEEALRRSRLPVGGVGLARVEFIFASYIRIHPLALLRFSTLPSDLQREIDELTADYPDKASYFIQRLAEGMGIIAAAFYPRPVLVRFSDFKSNEYARLVGGHLFEPHEENPMLGWRGASRYYHPDYKEAFLLEVAAVKRVRETWGLHNLHVMVPFCRTPEEGKKVLAVMEEGGLRRGENGLQVFVMAEIPSNIIEAEAFAEIFDGFSIGSNDLTQFSLGVDRDADRVAGLFDERQETVRRLCAMLIEKAHLVGKPVGICGQAPSDYPDFAAFLVEKGIDSMSLNADALLPVLRKVAQIEAALKG